MNDPERFYKAIGFKNVSGNWQFNGDMTPERALRILQDVTGYDNGWNNAIDTIKQKLGYRTLDVDGFQVEFPVQKMQQYLTSIKKKI